MLSLNLSDDHVCALFYPADTSHIHICEFGGSVEAAFRAALRGPIEGI